METRDRVAGATFHLPSPYKPVQLRHRWPVLLANTAGQYRWIVAIRCEDDCGFARCAYSPHRVAK
jgi:hypothetical protein